MKLAPMLATLLFFGGALAQGASVEVSGAWSGSFEIHFADGRILADTVWLELRQDGDTITGTVGPRAQQQKPIHEGRLAEGDIRFAADSTPGKQLKFVLRPAAGRLSGEALGDIDNDQVRVVVNVVRADTTSLNLPEALAAEISSLDARLFDAYNRRDIKEFMSMFASDLEFYDDRSGLTHFAENERNFRKALSEPALHRRELVAGTMRVFPLGKFGALETGIHKFYLTAPGRSEKLDAIAQFTLIWQHRDGKWQVSRALSYEHQ